MDCAKNRGFKTVPALIEKFTVRNYLYFCKLSGYELAKAVLYNWLSIAAGRIAGRKQKSATEIGGKLG